MRNHNPKLQSTQKLLAQLAELNAQTDKMLTKVRKADKKDGMSENRKVSELEEKLTRLKQAIAVLVSVLTMLANPSLPKDERTALNTRYLFAVAGLMSSLKDLSDFLGNQPREDDAFLKQNLSPAEYLAYINGVITKSEAIMRARVKTRSR